MRFTVHSRGETRQSGFTLIEIMIAVAVIGILAAIVYPSYREHVRAAHRADAGAALMELSQFMERYYTTNGRYSTSADGSGSPTLPFTTAPKDGTAVYDLRLGAIGTSTYRLEAVPKTGTMMAGDTCGTLSITNTGKRSQASGASQSTCWKR